ncbi:hypothetical protein AB0C93_25360 [Streptomyces sp. NPDC048518]|uniref:hypothetical protein n=1 Tax=Streptomyces sp. NPDC048518 TaxID=3155029 RepID=UPI003405C806
MHVGRCAAAALAGTDPDAAEGALDKLAAEPGDESCFSLPANVRTPPATREFADRAPAMEWYAAERDDLTPAAAAAHAAGLRGRTWRIVLALWPQIVWRVRGAWTPLLRTALEAARADGDPGAQARVLDLLAGGY